MVASASLPVPRPIFIPRSSMVLVFRIGLQILSVSDDWLDVECVAIMKC